ncbi:Gfo/Idh/MocA family oxidoreductase [Pelagibacterales bacterium SAG-MED20]|nr:Gfo/Idh/MocA family oxidoreductase [Pelagibacterales bacterium SAG-MED20]
MTYLNIMIKWGVIGAGKMGRTFAHSIKEVDNAKLIAVASLDNKRLNTFGSDFNINKDLRFTNYEMICKNSDIDAIYISTLNNTHLELIKLCATYKKKILCEKPFCLNLNEAEELESILKKNDIKFFEAIAYVSHPQTDNILNLVKSGEIGEIKKIESSFGFKTKRIKPESRLFNKKFGGGSILDVGCYPLSFVSFFSNKNNDIKFINVNGEICKTNVDISASANLLIDDKIDCSIKVSLKENFKNNCILYGSKQKIVVNNPWLPDKKTFLEVFDKDRYYKKFIETDLSVYANQIKNVSKKFLNDKIEINNLFDISKAVKNMKLLDFWKKNIN